MDLWLMRGISTHLQISSSDSWSEVLGPASRSPEVDVTLLAHKIQAQRLDWTCTHLLRTAVTSSEAVFGR